MVFWATWITNMLFVFQASSKPLEISKENWMERLQGMHITRADMNKLIMNYLVTGKYMYT